MYWFKMQQKLADVIDQRFSLRVSRFFFLILWLNRRFLVTFIRGR